MELVACSHHRPDETTTMAVYRYDLEAGERFGAHEHDQHQVSWTPTGVLIGEAGGAHWELPPTLALWIPAGLTHDIAARKDASLHNVKLNPRHCHRAFDDTTVLAATPLLTALAEHLADPSIGADERARAEAVFVDQLRPMTADLVRVPMPTDPRALAVVRCLVDRPNDDRSLAEWGRHVGASERTLARLFAQETALAFSGWRLQVRMRAAIVALDAGEPVSSIAPRVGYSGSSAFISAFHRAVGTTPGDYARQRRHRPSR